MQIAADGKVAIDRMRNFLMEKVPMFEENGVNIAQNDNLSVQNCKGAKKPIVQLISYVHSFVFYTSLYSNALFTRLYLYITICI